MEKKIKQNEDGEDKERAGMRRRSRARRERKRSRSRRQSRRRGRGKGGRGIVKQRVSNENTVDGLEIRDILEISFVLSHKVM